MRPWARGCPRPAADPLRWVQNPQPATARAPGGGRALLSAFGVAGCLRPG